MTQTEQSSKGIVYLVGAGPGDPGLITLRGADLLASAEIVVYDALANPRLLSHCPQAEKIYVGKRAASHSMSQEQINALLIEKAREGKRVVRLKGGDPFVFGRGGEECEALTGAGIRFEVVPGITAAIAAPAYAGIPVTHRDFNSSFTFLTGHEKEEEYRDKEAMARAPGAGSDIDWASVAKLPCLAFYMGVKSLPRICRKLIEHGMSPDTPAATIQWGTTPRQRTVVGTITDLPAKVIDAKIAPPAMTIVGRVVSMRSTMNWFESRPLFGKTILVTRAREQASELTVRLESLGARVMEAPAIELVPAGDTAAVNKTLADLITHPVDWIIFTSANGVKFTRQKLFELGLDVRVFGKAKIAAIGDATANAIAEHLGLRVDLCPKSFVAEALADELLQQNQIAGKRFLLLRADIARPLLRERLVQQAAASVCDLAIYQTRPVLTLSDDIREALAKNEVDWITFTSSSTVKNLIALLGDQYNRILSTTKLASIGPITSATLTELGLKVTVEASEFNLDGIVAAMLRNGDG
jgi:uroporphyrinogen III methyltransferase/synthase